MFFFSSAPSFYRHSGLALLLLQLNLFVFGLPPFHAGVWVQTEPVMLVEYIFAAFTGLWLVIGLSRKWLAQLSAHPLWIALLLWTLWQLIPTVLATSPWRSWFGPPQTGEGVAWNVVLLLNFMLACPLWQVARLRNILLGAAALQIAVNCPLYLYYDGGRENFYPLESWTPIQFPTFLAFQGIYLFIAAALAGLFRTRKNYIHAALALAVVLIISRCRSAMALCAVAITTSLLKFPRPGKLWRGLAIAACFSPLLWVALCHYAPDAAMLYNKESLLRPRVILNQVAVAALENEPSRVWIGNGWGRFGDDMFKYILVDGVDVYQHGARNPNTIMVDGGAFLSHSQPLEAFLSMGIVGFALWFAIPVIAIITLPELFFWPVAPIIVAWTMLGFVWFQFIECVPYEALTLAALANARPLAASKRSPVAMAILLLLLIVAMGWSVRQQAEALLYDAQIIEISRTTPETGNAIGWLTEDMKRGGDRMRTVGPMYLMQVERAAKHYTLTPAQAAWYSEFAQIERRFAESPAIGADASFIDVWSHYFTRVAFDKNPLFKDSGPEMEDALITLAQKAPRRDDIASPFLIDIDKYMGHDKQKQIDFLRRLLAVAPNHRGALWTLGGVLMQDDARKQEGIDMRKRAVEMGLGRVFPVGKENNSVGAMK